MKFLKKSSLYLCLTLLAPLTHAPLHAQKSPAIDEVMLEAQRYMEELSALSPEEQEKRILADIQKMDEDLKNMTPEQRKQFDDFMNSPELTEAMEEFLPVDEPFEEQAPEPTQAPKAKPAQPVVKEDEGKQEKAITLLTSIVKLTNQFLLQAGKMTTFAGKVKSWYADKNSPTLVLWPTPLEVKKENVDTNKKDTKEEPAKKMEATTEWTTISDHIATLVQKCEQLLAKDASNNYKYLNFFIEDKALYADLEKLNSGLSSYVDTVVIPEFGLGEISSSSERAIRNTINSLTEAIYSKQVVTAINTVIAKYEPTAKQLRTEQEARDKKALADSKRAPKQSRMVTAGSGKDGSYSDNSSAYDSYNPYGGYGSPYSSPTSGFDATKEDLGGRGESDTKNDGTTGGSNSGQQQPGVKPAEPSTEEKAIDADINSLSGTLDELSTSLASLGNLGQQVKSSKGMALSNTLSKVKNAAGEVKSAGIQARKVRNAIKRLKTKSESSANYYSGQLNKAIDPMRGRLENVLGQIRSINRTDVVGADGSGLDALKNGLESILGKTPSAAVFGAPSENSDEMPKATNSTTKKTSTKTKKKDTEGAEAEQEDIKKSAPTVKPVAPTPVIEEEQNTAAPTE